MHTGGDKDIDYYMDAIEEGAKKGGLTLDEARYALRRALAASNQLGPESLPAMLDAILAACAN